MRIPGRAALTACTLALAAVLLAACTPAHSDAEPTKTPKPTPTPIFTSDADALAAATTVYKRYLAVSDQIAQDGGKDADRLRPYVNSDGLKHEEVEAKRLGDAHAHQIGTTAVTAAKLQSRSNARVSIYACQDVSKVDVVDPSGKSLVDSSRPASIPYIATLEVGANGQLVVASDKYRDGENICP